MDNPQQLLNLKARLKTLLGRDVDVMKTRDGRYCCEFLDMANPKPLELVGTTEVEACEKLIAYLERRRQAEPEWLRDDEKSVEDTGKPG